MTERDPEVDPAELGNYEGVSGGEYTSQSGDPDAEAAKDAQAGQDDEEPEGS